MSGTPVAIGPFEGGLNLNEDPSQIADNQLAECINFDIGRAGELTTRAGLKAIRTSDNPISAVDAVPVIVGSITLPNLVSRLYVKQSDPAIMGKYRIYSCDVPENPTAPWTLVDNNDGYNVGDTRAVVYGIYDGLGSQQSFAWFIPYGEINGVASTALAQDLTTNTVYYTLGIPRGSGGIVFKSRMFVYGPMSNAQQGTYRIYYSAVGNFTSFPVNNFFDVGPGDGDQVMAMAVQGDALVIFKRNSTWSLHFETDPFLGTLRKINNELGATGPQAVAAFGNELYIISRQSIHRLTSLLFEDIGQNLNLYKVRSAHKSNDSISIIGTKILCSIATGKPENPYRHFVYHTLVDAWSEYSFGSLMPTRFVSYLDFEHALHQFSTGLGTNNIYHMHPVATNAENYGDYPLNVTDVKLTTKRYIYDNPSVYKRLYWWALDVVTYGNGFTMYCQLDGKRSSLENERTTVTNIATLVKAAVAGRFRSIQYIFEASAVNGYFRIHRGEARINLKKEVDSGTPH